jgi:hypothetical protein
MNENMRQLIFHYRHQLTLLLSAFVLGLLLGGSLYWHAKRQVVVKQDEIVRITEEKNSLLRKLAAAEVEARILRASQQDMKKDLDERQKTIAEHETSLEFYRQLMVVGNKKEGLDLNTYSIVKTDTENQYHFRFTFVQYAKQHAQITFKVKMRLEGEDKGVVAIYYLKDLLLEPHENFGELSFKYFQSIEGEITWPATFKPQQIVIDANFNKKNSSWQRKLPWQIEESL